MYAQSIEAARDLPLMEMALKRSKLAKIDPTRSNDADTSPVSLPNGELSNVQWLVAARNKNAKDQFLDELTRRTEQTIQTLTIGPRPLLQMFHVEDGIEVGKAGLLYDDGVSVVQILNEREFLGKTQSSRYTDVYLFRGWETAKLKDGGRIAMKMEPVMCLANESYETAIGAKRTVLVVQTIPAETLRDVVAKVEREAPKLQPMREWTIGKDAKPVNARLCDFDKKTISLQFDDNSTKVIDLSQFSQADKSYVLKQRQFKPSK
jgi:hypothetical protein